MKKSKEKNIYLINISIVLFILVVILIRKKASIFGDNTIIVSDGIFQFEPMIYGFIQSIKQHLLQSYSFSNGLGNPFVFNYLYYLISPVNFIGLLFKKPDGMYSAILLVKIIIATICMTKYAKYKTDKWYLNTIAVLSYVFSAWFVAYYFYLPWLDTFMIFPLLQYGLEKLINGEGNKVYIFSLAYIVVTNFYLAFSVCIYVILYLLVTFIFKSYNKKEMKIIIGRFLKNSIISVLLISVFLYALADSYLRMGLSFDSLVKNYSTTLPLLIRSFIPSCFSVVIDHSAITYPNMSSTFIILLFNTYFLFSKKVDRRDKIMVIVVSAIVLLFVLVPHFDYVLNMFHNVRGFPYRYSFIIIFLQIKLFLYIGDKSAGLEKIKKIIILFVMGLLIILLKNYLYLNNRLVFVSVLILIMYIIFYLLFDNNKYHYVLLVGITILSVLLVLNNSLNYVYSKEPFNYVYNKEDSRYRSYDRNIPNYNYYVDNYYNTNLNLGLYSNAKMISLHTSMTYNKVVNLLKDLGNTAANNFFVLHNSSNKFVNLIFNVKDYIYLEKIFAVDKDVKNVELINDHPRLNQERVIESMTGIKDIYDSEILKGEFKDGQYYYNIISGCYFIDSLDQNNNPISKVQGFINFTSDESQTKVYYFNEVKYDEIYKRLAKNQIKYSKYKDSYLEGDIRVDKDQIIFTSIPYDTNWHVYVDGKKVKPIKIFDSLMGIETTEGKHHIVLKYGNYNFIIPAIISAIVFIYIIKRRNI